MEERPGEDADAPDINMGSHVSSLVRVRDFKSEGAEFLENAKDMVHECFEQGFQQFQKVINEDQSLGLSDEAKFKIFEDIEDLYDNHVQEALDSSLADWERDALRKVFALPPALLLPQPQAPGASNGAVYNPAEEQALDAELQELRERIEQTTASSAGLKNQLRATDREISRCQREAESLKTIVGSAEGDAVGEAARQVAGMAARLQPLLAKAEQLRSQRRGPLARLRDRKPAVAGSDRGWLDKLQIGGPEDIALLRSTFGAQPAVSQSVVSTRSEEVSKSQPSVQQ
ncbi:hypothetical protein KFL_007710050 [Klebsormidium nitens]|uniref:Uncharacterized protein n=1 Tax=Klebsormidium nitens TaxID=105231 RepID=A0A1Y1IKF1_KLENI|nr:hypothetical protein KFL_007710050 [Klebsormidium nitens]|eukprot:GAQ91355.1 hypothetical protein KFL_007710050 [Klebsormidium nitens]